MTNIVSPALIAKLDETAARREEFFAMHRDPKSAARKAWKAMQNFRKYATADGWSLVKDSPIDTEAGGEAVLRGVLKHIA